MGGFSTKDYSLYLVYNSRTYQKEKDEKFPISSHKFEKANYYSLLSFSKEHATWKVRMLNFFATLGMMDLKANIFNVLSECLVLLFIMIA